MSPLGGCEAAAAVCIQTYSVPTVKKCSIIFGLFWFQVFQLIACQKHDDTDVLPQWKCIILFQAARGLCVMLQRGSRITGWET